MAKPAIFLAGLLTAAIALTPIQASAASPNQTTARMPTVVEASGGNQPSGPYAVQSIVYHGPYSNLATCTAVSLLFSASYNLAVPCHQRLNGWWFGSIW